MRTGSVSTTTELSPQRARLIGAIGYALIATGTILLLARVLGIMVSFSDFTYDYVTAQAFLDRRSIYSEFSPTDLSAARLGTAAPLERAAPFTNIHPPFDALLFAPLALLPYNLAALLWSALSFALYVWIAITIIGELDIQLAGHWRILLIGMGLCWYPLLMHIALGQLSLLIVGCLIGCWALLRHQRDGWAGVLLGLACLIKLYPALLVLVLLLRRRWRAAGAALGTIAAGGLLTLLLVGPGDVLRYGMQVISQATGEHGLSPVNASLAGVLGRLLSTGPWVTPLVDAPRAASALFVLIALGLLTLLARQQTRLAPTAAGDDRAWALGCIAMLLLSPITWQHSFPALLLPLGLLLRNAQLRPERAGIALLLLTALLVSLPDVSLARVLMNYYSPYNMPWFAALALLAPTIGMALLWWQVGTRLDRRVQDTSTASI